MQVLFRDIEAGDLKDINRIYNESIQLGIANAHSKRVGMDYHLNWFESHQKEANPILVAEAAGKCIAWNALSSYRPGRQALAHVRESSYYVDEAYWGRGIASQLMEQIILRAREMEVKILITFIMGANKPSIRLMEKYHFKLWGQLPGIIKKGNALHDHLIFGRKI